MILSRVRLLPQIRYDLEHFISQQSGVRTDSKFYTKRFISDENYIVEGFTVSGLGSIQATLVMDKATLLFPENTTDFSWFTAEDSPDDIIISAGDLTDNTKNYIEVYLETETNTPVVSAFWDPTANSGNGAEFTQEEDIITDLKVSVDVRTGGFSGDPDRIPVAIIDVNNSGIIVGIRDKRNLFHRLGSNSDPYKSFNFTSRIEPGITLTLSSVSGTYEAGETVTFTSGATATVVTGGTNSILVNLLSNDSFAVADTVTGGTSGATGALDQYSESFTGADKNIKDVKDDLDALKTLIKEITGQSFWYMQPNASLLDIWKNLGVSLLVGGTSTARFSWSGADLVITDDNGSPTTNDVLAYLRDLTSTADLALTRETIALADGEIAYIELPTTGSRTYNGTGATASNYQIVARGSLPDTSNIYWLAYREGTKLYVRGLGELEAGEERQISDETTSALQEFLGFDPETATSVPYTTVPDAAYTDQQFSTADPLVTAISVNAYNINDLAQAISKNVYEEKIEVVSSITGPNQILGPVAVDTIISLPADTRNGNATFNYEVGAGIFEVYINGQFVTPLMDETYIEVGAAESLSNDIQIKQELSVGDTLIFRSDSTGGYKFIGGTPSQNLQDTYNQGRTIVVASGQPIEISGPGGEKLLRIFGDIEVTGVIDPAGLELTRQATDPLDASADGIWVNNSGDLMYTKNGASTVNLYNAGAGASSSIRMEDTFTNNTGSLISKGTPVRINASGTLELIDVNVEAEVDAVVGITAEDIADSASGYVVFGGRLTEISTAIAVGSAVYISKVGLLTSTKPSIGVNGFVAGDYIVRVGTIIVNKDNPANKDFLINISDATQL